MHALKVHYCGNYKGVLVFLGKIAWGCQISRGTGMGATAGHKNLGSYEGEK